MFDHAAHAQEIAGWTGLGVKLPKPLADAVTVFETIRYTEVGYPVNVDVWTITAENVEAKIEELADYIVLGENRPGALSPRQQAKLRMRDAAAAQVIREAGAAVPDIIEQLTPDFDKHVETYCEAVVKLPKPADLSDQALIEAGPDAVAAFVVARDEASYLEKISWWVASTGRLPGHFGTPDPVLHILRPSVVFLPVLDTAQERASQPGASNALAAINPVFAQAAWGREAQTSWESVEFAINTFAEIREIRERGVLTGEAANTWRREQIQAAKTTSPSRSRRL